MEALFDLADEYDSMLRQGLRLSGEDRRFFLAGRLRLLQGLLPTDFRVARILDFGCGIGDAAFALADMFPEAEVVGCDTADRALERARLTNTSDRITFVNLADVPALPHRFDLCYTNGVFHHIRPQERPGAMSLIFRATRSGGVLGLFENNPWNPGTRLVMSKVPFDRDAVLLSIREARRMVRDAGFTEELAVRTLFYFPRALAPLRVAEPALGKLPLGAQYCVLARRG